MSGEPFPPDIVSSRVLDFVRGCARAVTVCAQAPDEQRMALQFSNAVSRATPIAFAPRPVAALRSLPLIGDMKLARDFSRFARLLPWDYSPRTSDCGEQLAILDFRKILVLPDVIAGLMYVDAGCAYPEHSHPPAELYFILSGTASWRYGGHDGYRTLTAGNLLYNHPGDRHGVRADITPVLAMYLQTG